MRYRWKKITIKIMGMVMLTALALESGSKRTSSPLVKREIPTGNVHSEEVSNRAIKNSLYANNKVNNDVVIMPVQAIGKITRRKAV